MNSARAFGKFPSDITDIVETYVPGAAAFLPLLYSFAGFNVISYVWQKIILGFAGFFLVSVSIAATDTLCGEVIDWLAVNVINRRGLGAVSLNASKAKQGIFGPTRTRRYLPCLAYPLLSYDSSHLRYVIIQSDLFLC